MKTKLLFTLFLLMGFCAQAQNEPAYKEMMHDPSVNFYTVCEEAENYFKTIDRHAKGSGWKPFQRWKHNNEYKYYPSGVRNNVAPDFVEKNYESIRAQFANMSYKLFPNGWEELGPLSVDSITGHYSAGLGRIEDMYISPTDSNRIYVGSRSGGFWRTVNEGATWIGGATDFLPATGVNTIAVSPTNSDSILINVQNARNEYSHGVYRSTDGGITFSQSNFNPTTTGFGGLGAYFLISKIAYHPRVPDLIYIATTRGIYRSDDNLQTWTRLFNNNHIVDIQFHPTDDNIIYLFNNTSGLRDNIFISTDQGLSYTASNTIPGATNQRARLSVSPDCPHCVYFALSAGVWRSTDSGQNFTFLINPNEACRAFAVSDLDTSKMIYGYADVEASVDGGQSFNQVTYWSLGNTNGAGSGNQISYETSTNYVHADIRNAKCVNGTFYAATDGLLCKSNDDGTNWQSLTNDIGIRENYRLGTSQSNHYKTVCGSQDNGISLKVQDSWIEVYGADGMEAFVHPLNEDWMLFSTQGGNRRISKNSGQTSAASTPSGSSSGDWLAPMAFDPIDHMTVYDFRDSIYKSTDFASSYSVVGGPASFTGVITSAAIAENNSDIMVVSRNENIDISTDGGVTFTSIKNSLPNFKIEDIAFDPSDDNTIVVVNGSFQNNNSKVFITTNGGTSWTNITNNLGDMPIRSVVIDHTPDRNIYLGAEIGVYTKPMSGNTWTLLNTDLPNTSVLEMEINYGSNTLKAATWGRGLWEYNLVGRADYPAIVHTTITNPPTELVPKENVDQYVTSRISYDNTLSSVFVSWSADSISLGNIIPMTNTADSTWVSNTPLPDVAAGTKLYFKVFAVGGVNDTSETYRFMYTQKPFEYCDAMGSSTSGNLHLDSVSLSSINNGSTNDTYSFYQTPIPTLGIGGSYAIYVSANTAWANNDYGAWIDYNNDAEFTPDEQVLLSMNPGSSTATNTFTVPSTANINDTVRMRVRLSYFGNGPSPCGTTFGEVEDYQVVISSTPLQVHLSSFKVMPSKNEALTSVVNWTTESEKNIRNYEILHSLNGLDFEPIYSKNDIQDSETTMAYSYEHQNAQIGTNCYKIRTHQMSGDYTESEVKSVYFSRTEKPFAFYPNPTKNGIWVEIYNDEIHNFEIRSIDGKLLKKIVFKPSDQYIDFSELPNGVYLLSSGSTTARVIKK